MPSSTLRSFRMLLAAGLLVVATADRGLAQLGFVRANQRIAPGVGGLPAGLVNSGDQFGRAVGNADDLDGDGILDLIVGAPFAGEVGSDFAVPNAGLAFYVRLLADGTVKGASLIGGFDFLNNLTPGDRFGAGVARLSFGNKLDFAVGAPGDSELAPGAGTVWLIRDAEVGGSMIRVPDPLSGSGNIALRSGDSFGAAVAAIDIDGDESQDVVVGAPGYDVGETANAGAVFIVFRNASNNDASGSVTLTPGVELDGAFTAGDAIGSAVTGIGDLNGDSFSDIVIGAPGDDTGGADTGSIRVVFLDRAGAVLGSRKIVAIDPDLLTAGVNLSPNDRFGSSLATGDIDGDGDLELFVGAPGTDGKGAVWMLSLSQSGFVLGAKRLGSLPGEASFALGDGDNFGAGLAVLEDFDGTGFGSVAIGHPENNPERSAAGAVWVAFLGACGDGNLDADEQCDDGNHDTGDCCSPSCKFDPDTTTCDEGDPCTTDQCTMGACLTVGIPDPSTPCDDKDECTENDICGAGTCGGTPRDCSVLDSPCQLGSCVVHEILGAMCISTSRPDSTACSTFDPCTVGQQCVSGSCTGGSPAMDGTVCDDDDKCTGLDECTAGTCSGSPLDCSSLDMGCEVGFCNPEAGLCELRDAADNRVCDDGNSCTTLDSCAGGVCLGTTAADGTSCEDGDLCTEADQCSGGFCSATPKDCGAFADACNLGRCDAATGNCFADPDKENPACDDGDPCTENDQCAAGVCAGTPKDCSASGDQCNVGTCNASTGACEAIPKIDGTSCSDGDLCTVSDQCQSGSCTATPTDCSSAGDQCNEGTCNAGTGACETTPKIDGTSCSDDDLCTVSDQCVSGSCTATATDCSSAGDQCNDGTCNANTGACEPTPKTDGTSCSDGDLCTVSDQCQSGSCTATATDCSSAGDQCNDGTCNAGTGACEPTPKSNGTSCSDSDLCTVSDQCVSGSCTATPTDCTASGDQCNDGTCNATTGACVPTPKSDGTSCSDDDLCTVSDQCASGSCTATPTDCSSAGDQCNDGTCDAGTGACEPTPKVDGTSCSDGDLCTVSDQCISGSCTATPTDCTASGDQCNDGTCNANTGACEPTPKTDGTSCSDGDLCTVSDQCLSGSCAATATDCSSAGDQCNDGTCNANTGACEPTPKSDGTSCSDGDLCTVSDQCLSGSCTATPTDCSSAGDQCNDGACNTNTGACEPTPKIDGTSCSDGDLCTVSDQCVSGSCTATPTDCSSAGDQCNDGACNTNTGACEPTPKTDGTSCSDDDLCTGSDQCESGSCIGNTKDCSVFNNQCNDFSCNANTGGCEPTSKADGTSCSDDDLCSENDQCQSGTCTASAKDCSPFTDECNTGACDSATGLCLGVDRADGTPCDDQAFCTKTDACTGGTCIGAGDACAGKPACESTCNESLDSCLAPAGAPCENDGNVCTDDVCDGSGVCGTFNTASCDDGLFCTKNDICSGGVCSGPETCPLTPVCSDTCNEDEDACRTCGHPFSNARCVVNAVFVLQGSIGLRPCDLCTCDVDSSFTVTVSDALSILRTCANLPQALTCVGAVALPPPVAGLPATSTTSTTLRGESDPIDQQ